MTAMTGPKDLVQELAVTAILQVPSQPRTSYLIGDAYSHRAEDRNSKDRD